MSTKNSRKKTFFLKNSNDTGTRSDGTGGGAGGGGIKSLCPADAFLAKFRSAAANDDVREFGLKLGPPVDGGLDGGRFDGLGPLRCGGRMGGAMPGVGGSAFDDRTER
jgi:hypothetical protein